MKYVILAGLLLLVLVEYALMVVAHEADEQAERMYEEWRREHDEADRCRCGERETDAVHWLD